jgi:hypothetical protein
MTVMPTETDESLWWFFRIPKSPHHDLESDLRERGILA